MHLQDAGGHAESSFGLLDLAAEGAGNSVEGDAGFGYGAGEFPGRKFDVMLKVRAGSTGHDDSQEG